MRLSAFACGELGGAVVDRTSVLCQTLEMICCAGKTKVGRYPVRQELAHLVDRNATWDRADPALSCSGVIAGPPVGSRAAHMRARSGAAPESHLSVSLPSLPDASHVSGKRTCMLFPEISDRPQKRAHVT